MKRIKEERVESARRKEEEENDQKGDKRGLKRKERKRDRKEDKNGTQEKGRKKRHPESTVPEIHWSVFLRFFFLFLIFHFNIFLGKLKEGHI